jgi:phytoene dehydrogenase-like protein
VDELIRLHGARPILKPDVIIIGAGAAGLAAAEVLSKNDLSVVIVEVRNRIGGRILTHRDPTFGMPIELGAEFIHGRPEVTWNLLRQAGMSAVDLPFDHRVRRHGRLVRLPDTETELGKVFSGLTHLGRRDISFAQYLRNRPGKASIDARRFAVHFVSGRRRRRPGADQRKIPRRGTGGDRR